jgi:hypothetical protein
VQRVPNLVANTLKCPICKKQPAKEISSGGLRRSHIRCGVCQFVVTANTVHNAILRWNRTCHLRVEQKRLERRIDEINIAFKQVYGIS